MMWCVFFVFVVAVVVVVVVIVVAVAVAVAVAVVLSVSLLLLLLLLLLWFYCSLLSRATFLPKPWKFVERIDVHLTPKKNQGIPKFNQGYLYDI